LYTQGSSTDALDLITDMKDFAVASGWTLNDFSTEGNGKRLHINKGSMYFNFRYYQNEAPSFGGGTIENGIFCNGSTGYNGANPWHTQPGAPTVPSVANGGINQLNGAIPSWHFFSFNNASWEGLYFIVENPAGIYQWILCGSLDKTKYGTSTGGMFSTGLLKSNQGNESASPVGFFGNSPRGWSFNPRGFLYIDNGSGAKWACSFEGGGVLATPRCFDSIFRSSSFLYDQPNSFNSLPILVPISVNVFVDGNNFFTNTPWSPVGELPYVYWVNIKTLNPATTFTIASDQYKAFPFLKKTTVGQQNAGNPRLGGTEYMGFAIKTN